jgi:hypothetical protein
LVLLATAALVSALFIRANAGGVDTVLNPLNSLKTLLNLKSENLQDKVQTRYKSATPENDPPQKPRR